MRPHYDSRLFFVNRLFILNQRMKSILIGVFFIIIFSAESLLAQPSARTFDFDSIYNKAMGAVNSDPNTSRQYLKKLESCKKQLSPLQQAQTNFLRLRVIYADTNAVKALEKRMFSAPDSLDPYEALIYSARRFLEKSKIGRAHV